MNAVFKSKDRILINGSDKDERILIKEFISNFSLENKQIEIKPLQDINGEECGMSIEIVDKTVDTVEESN